MASSENGTMTLEQARQVASQAVMRLGSYDPASSTDRYRLDSAIKAAGDEFSMRLFPVRKNFKFTVPSGAKWISFRDASAAPSWVVSTSYSIGQLVQNAGSGYECMVAHTAVTAPSADPTKWAKAIVVPADFSCRRVRMAEMIDPTSGRSLRQSIVDLDSVKDYVWRQLGLVYYPNVVIPSAVGFSATRDGLTAFDPENEQQWFYPGTSADMVESLDYWVPFTAWTLGTATPSSVTLNIPDTMIYGVLYYLVPQFFDLAQASNDYIKNCQTKMKEHYSFCTRALKGSSTQMGIPLYGGISQSYGGF